MPVKITSQKSPLDVTLEVKEAPAKGMGTRNRPQSVLTTASSLAHSPAPLHRALVASWMETIGGGVLAVLSWLTVDAFIC